MLIFGHPHIENEKLYHISSTEAIKHTPSNSTLLFDYNNEVFELISYARENALEFALDVTSLKDALFAENLDAKYILTSYENASVVQRAVDTYLFDAKLLIHVQDESKMEDLAQHGIDGIIFAEAIIKVS